MTASFKFDDIFISSYVMMRVEGVSYDALVARFGFGDGYDTWNGTFTSKDGSEMRASFWSHNDSLYNAGMISVWIRDNMYLQEFADFIKGI